MVAYLFDGEAGSIMLADAYDNNSFEVRVEAQQRNELK